MQRTGALAIPLAATTFIRRLRMPAAASPAPDGRMRILVLAFEHQLGSVMAVTPLLRALRQAQPAAVITVAGHALLNETLAANPHVDRILPVPDPHDGRFTVLAATVRGLLTRRGALHGEPCDWLVTTSACRRTMAALLALSLPADRRAGLGPPTASRHYEAPVAYDEGASVILNNLQAAAVLGAAAMPQEPEIHITTAAAERAGALLRENGITENHPRAVFIAQTSGGQPTAWPAERMAALADRLADTHGLAALFVGTADGEGEIAAIRRRMRTPSVSLAGRTRIPELAALLALSDLAVAVDTGAMHVARAAGVPMVVIASSWQEAHHWLPRGVATCTLLARPDVGCAPCHKAFCATRECLDAITVEDGVTAAAALLVRFPSSPTARRQRLAALAPIRAR